MNKIPIEPDNYYHIYNHSNGFENIFIDDRDRQRFLEKYVKYIVPIANTYAYCLMANHFHFLVKIKPIEELFKITTFEGLQSTNGMITKKISYQFSHFFNSYAQSFNRRYNRMGGLFISNFGRKHVNKEKYFLKLVHYIHSNPIEHGFIDDIAEWTFSSFHEIIEGNSAFISI
jgi:putative transposase